MVSCVFMSLCPVLVVCFFLSTSTNACLRAVAQQHDIIGVILLNFCARI